jgi:2,3-bisphosphoglycerate-independent phosphoglycerate mutase
VPLVIGGRGVEPDGVQSFDEAVAREGSYGMVEAMELGGRRNNHETMSTN